MFLYLGIYPSSSPILSIESSILDTTNILNNALRDYGSIAIANALKNPAIGAFILSFWLKFLRRIHKNALYAILKRQVKPPNLADLTTIDQENL